MNVPPTLTSGGPPVLAKRCKLDHRLGLACGAHDCHALTTRPASVHGQPRKKTTSERRSCVRKVKDVATPKLPPPPPRLAQYRSQCALVELQESVLPSAVTICSDSMASLVGPYCLPSTPTPPPRARPASPTVGHEPPGTALPRAASPA